MLRYDRQTRAGLVALYDIWPGNGAGPFLQPWSPDGVNFLSKTKSETESLLTVQKFLQIRSNTKVTKN